jgi:hypothetical protein
VRSGKHGRVQPCGCVQSIARARRCPLPPRGIERGEGRGGEHPKRSRKLPRRRRANGGTEEGSITVLKLTRMRLGGTTAGRPSHRVPGNPREIAAKDPRILVFLQCPLCPFVATVSGHPEFNRRKQRQRRWKRPARPRAFVPISAFSLHLRVFAPSRAPFGETWHHAKTRRREGKQKCGPGPAFAF